MSSFFPMSMIFRKIVSFFRSQVSSNELDIPLTYRARLFEEFLEQSESETWMEWRILEIGPKDGLDSRRLAGLAPDELVFIELPEKREIVERWLPEIKVDKKIIYENFAYLPRADLEALGQFDLIWCTGVLYHNAEQLRFLRKLYRRLAVGGYLVLESATLRGDERLADGCYVEIHYPQKYRDSTSMTHLPSAKVIMAWLSMVGFKEIQRSKCFDDTNPDLAKQRMACICRKTGEDNGDGYYGKPGSEQAFIFGDST